jgi:hypothetical protein
LPPDSEEEGEIPLLLKERFRRPITFVESLFQRVVLSSVKEVVVPKFIVFVEQGFSVEAETSGEAVDRVLSEGTEGFKLVFSEVQEDVFDEEEDALTL